MLGKQVSSDLGQHLLERYSKKLILVYLPETGIATGRDFVNEI